MDESVYVIGTVLFFFVFSALVTLGIFRAKGRSGWGGFALGLFLPVIGIVIAMFLPSNQEKLARRKLARSKRGGLGPKIGLGVLALMIIGLIVSLGVGVGTNLRQLSDRRKRAKQYGETLEKCLYTGGSVVTRKRADLRVTILDPKDGYAFATHTLKGQPPKSCPLSTGGDKTIVGSTASFSDFKEWLEPLV